MLRLHTAKTVVPTYIQIFSCALDYGMDPRVREHPPFKPDAVYLSHAHLDHSGFLPLLEDVSIYSTAATKEVARLLLLDAVKVMKEKHEIPLYTEEDVHRIMKNFKTVDRYGDSIETELGEVVFFDAGHILGSSVIYFKDLDLLYTGDIGHGRSLLMKEPQHIEAETLIIEGTYAGREHPKESAADVLAKIINETKKKVLIPVFSVGRAQEILFILKILKEGEKIPDIPVYFDSPLAQNVTDLYRNFMYYLKPEFRDYFVKGEDPFKFEGLEYIKGYNRSLDVAEADERCIILAGSGMLEGGRALNHLPKILQDKNSAIVFVGYQAENTLGRLILESREGEEIPLEDRRVRRFCKVHAVTSLSSHADHNDLLRYVVRVGAKKVFITHSESPEVLAKDIRKYGIKVYYAEKPGESFDLKHRKKERKENVIIKMKPTWIDHGDFMAFPFAGALIKRGDQIEVVDIHTYAKLLEALVPSAEVPESVKATDAKLTFDDALEKLKKYASKSQIRNILDMVDLGRITSCEQIISYANRAYSKNRIGKEFRDALVEVASSFDFSTVLRLLKIYLEV